jgi:hypothetical protein
MGFINNLGLVLLTMVGYSIGRVLIARKYKVAAELFDGAIIVAVWICAILSQVSGRTHSIWLWIGVGFLSGLIVTPLAHSSLLLDNQKQIAGNKRNLFQILWGEWKSLAFRMGNFQGRLILLLFYFTILIPFGIINSIFRDPLNLKKMKKDTYWFSLNTSDNELENARRQY